MSPPTMVPDLEVVAWTPIEGDPDGAEECRIGPFRVAAAPPNTMRFGWWLVMLNGHLLASQHLEVRSIAETKRLGLEQVQYFAYLLVSGVGKLWPLA
jgi:hypothetical protein